MRAICYCRVKPRDSLGAEEHAGRLRGFAASAGYEAAEVRVETAGKKPDLQRLMREAKRYGTDVILVPSLVHLTRDRTEFMGIFEALAAEGIKLVSARGEDPAGLYSLCRLANDDPGAAR